MLQVCINYLLWGPRARAWRVYRQDLRWAVWKPTVGPITYTSGSYLELFGNLLWGLASIRAGATLSHLETYFWAFKIHEWDRPCAIPKPTLGPEVRE